MEANLAKRRAAYVQSFDKNHDGVLDEQETAAMNADLATRRDKYLDVFTRSAF